MNALFLVGFPLFGYSSYYGATNGLSKGFIMAAAPFVAIILFHFIDTLYRGALSAGSPRSGGVHGVHGHLGVVHVRGFAPRHPRRANGQRAPFLV
ncbi:MAG: hypothetical protein IPI81_17120 [Flavobacteriales bacterium]|nr:hypothetical protein [Flavobacteriales bacterium]